MRAIGKSLTCLQTVADIVIHVWLDQAGLLFPKMLAALFPSGYPALMVRPMANARWISSDNECESLELKTAKPQRYVPPQRFGHGL
jgi:hypothetical protein